MASRYLEETKGCLTKKSVSTTGKILSIADSPETSSKEVPPLSHFRSAQKGCLKIGEITREESHHDSLKRMNSFETKTKNISRKIKAINFRLLKGIKPQTNIKYSRDNASRNISTNDESKTKIFNKLMNFSVLSQSIEDIKPRRVKEHTRKSTRKVTFNI